jgi:preprotein translocase subunit SecE
VTDTQGATATPERGRAPKGADRLGLVARLALFYRQVVAELRKVIRPTRTELITYTTVVIVFVAVMIAIVSVLDFLFTHAVLWVFG